MVKSRAAEGEADLRWIDARYQIAECLTEHALRTSEEVLQLVINQAQWRIAGEEYNAGDTTGRKKDRGEAKKVSSKSEMNADYADVTLSWRKVNIEVRTTPCFALHMTRNCALDVSNIRTTTVDESLCRTCCFHGHLVTSVFETLHSSSATVLLSLCILRIRCPTSFARGLLATQMSGVVCRSDEFVHERGQWLRRSVSCGHLYYDLCKVAVNLLRFPSCVRDAITIMFTPAHPSPVFVEHGSRLCCGPSGAAVVCVNQRVRGHTQREDAWLLACPHFSLVGAGDLRYPNRYRRKHWDCML